MTHASIGHTDAMFFQFFEGDGAKSLLRGDDVAVEAGQQLASLSDEVASVLGNSSPQSAPRGPEN